MTSLLTNNAAMTALTTLKNINQSLDTTSNRVSTGQRVSAAADNAAYWSIATTVRTDNASLGAVKDALGLGSSAVDTAYNGLNSIISDLQNMRAKLQTALTPGVDRTKVQTEIAAIQSKMRATRRFVGRQRPELAVGQLGHHEQGLPGHSDVWPAFRGPRTAR